MPSPGPLGSEGGVKVRPMSTQVQSQAQVQAVVCTQDWASSDLWQLGAAEIGARSNAQ